VCLFYKESVCTNMLKSEVLNIIGNMTENKPGIIKTNQKEIVYTLRMVLKQHYFQFGRKHCKEY
jgi:hypothetical protein